MKNEHLSSSRLGARPFLASSKKGANIRVTYRDRKWISPRGECVPLAVASTTAKLLADHIAGRLRQEMARRGWVTPRVLRVEVEECFGQSAEVEWQSR